MNFLGFAIPYTAVVAAGAIVGWELGGKAAVLDFWSKVLAVLGTVKSVFKRD